MDGKWKWRPRDPAHFKHFKGITPRTGLDFRRALVIEEDDYRKMRRPTSSRNALNPSRMAEAVYAIEDFPDDDLLWRIEWIGGVGLQHQCSE